MRAEINMKKKYIVFLSILLLVNFQCRYSLVITHEIDKNGVVNFNIEFNSPFSKNKINNIRVTDLHNNEIVWSIWADDPIALDKFIYGRVPNGFKEYQKEKKLIRDREYKVSVTGLGISGSKEFKYIY
jgi:hypothetical protein